MDLVGCSSPGTSVALHQHTAHLHTGGGVWKAAVARYRHGREMTALVALADGVTARVGTRQQRHGDVDGGAVPYVAARHRQQVVGRNIPRLVKGKARADSLHLHLAQGDLVHGRGPHAHAVVTQLRSLHTTGVRAARHHRPQNVHAISQIDRYQDNSCSGKVHVARLPLVQPAHTPLGCVALPVDTAMYSNAAVHQTKRKHRIAVRCVRHKGTAYRAPSDSGPGIRAWFSQPVDISELNTLSPYR